MNPWRNTAKPSPPRPRWLNSEDSEKEDKEWPSLHPEIEEKQRGGRAMALFIYFIVVLNVTSGIIALEPNSYVPDKRPGTQMEPTDVDGSSLGERNWLKVTFFCLVAALPITICSLLLALVVFTPEVALEETNT
ncbi:hypothetical protein MRX96_045038, partial [Rhipicephalus microplus]